MRLAKNRRFDASSLPLLRICNLEPRTRKRKDFKREWMDKFLIKGGKALRGTVAVSGAKNSALPAMAAALLTADKVVVRNVPKVRDLVTMSKLLAFMHAKVSVAAVPASEYVIEAPKLNHEEAPYELVKTMRASILTLGPLMARVGGARVSLPGGCAIGARPVDLHLKALEQMGAEIATSHGYIEAKVPGNGSKGPRLKGARIVFEKMTRSEEHTSELQSQFHLVCRLLLEKKKKKKT